MDIEYIELDELNSILPTLKQQEKNYLLFEAIDYLQSRAKIESILQHGANPNQNVANEIMLWTIAFQRDTIKNSNRDEIILDLLFSYIFELHDEKFKEEVKNIVNKYLDKHNYLVAKSNLYYKNLGYEPEDAKKELDNQYYTLLDDLSDEINDCYYEVMHKK